MPTGPVRLADSVNLEEYSLVMSEIDALVRAICEAANIKHLKTLTTMYREPGKTFLREENAEVSLFE